jgi:hypothetical protein
MVATAHVRRTEGVPVRETADVSTVEGTVGAYDVFVSATDWVPYFDASRARIAIAVHDALLALTHGAARRDALVAPGIALVAAVTVVVIVAGHACASERWTDLVVT